MSVVVSGHREISHSGQFSGFSAFNAWYPDQALSVTVLTNTAPMPMREILARNLALEVDGAALKRHVFNADGPVIGVATRCETEHDRPAATDELGGESVRQEVRAR